MYYVFNSINRIVIKMTWRSLKTGKNRKTSLRALYTIICNCVRFTHDLESLHQNFEHVQKPLATDFNPTIAQKAKINRRMISDT